MNKCKWYAVLLLGLALLLASPVLACGKAEAPVTGSAIFVLSADPSEISPDEAANLCWAVEDGSVVKLDHGIGRVPVCGCIHVLPSATTVYTLTATSGAATVAKAVVVTVTTLTSPVESPPPVQLWHKIYTDPDSFYQFAYPRDWQDLTGQLQYTFEEEKPGLYEIVPDMYLPDEILPNPYQPTVILGVHQNKYHGIHLAGST